MHWTQLLEKRYFPANATVVEDVPCSRCGYNLRGLRARGRCPECGLDVGNSLYLLTKPQVVSSSFTALGSSYLAFLILPALPFIPSNGLVWLALLILVAGSMVRLWCAFMLRFRSGLLHLPAIGNQTTRLLAIAVAEFTLLIAVIAAVYLSLRMTAFNWRAFGPASLVLWWLLALGTAFQSTLLASRLGTLLGFDLIRRDALRQRICLAVVLAMSLVLLIARTASSVNPVIGIVMCSLMPPALLALLFTMLCLWHTGNAAAQAGELLEDAVDSELESDVDRRPSTAPPKLPDIRLE